MTKKGRGGKRERFGYSFPSAEVGLNLLSKHMDGMVVLVLKIFWGGDVRVLPLKMFGLNGVTAVNRVILDIANMIIPLHKSKG